MSSLAFAFAAVVVVVGVVESALTACPFLRAASPRLKRNRVSLSATASDASQQAAAVEAAVVADYANASNSKAPGAAVQPTHAPVPEGAPPPDDDADAPMEPMMDDAAPGDSAKGRRFPVVRQVRCVVPVVPGDSQPRS